ncbi:to cystathionine beta-synthase beta-thionase [Geosmithia morbida]|uniref:To cystathionine beta-synthase beta-thionase n=1 Tax=Geosmithia morbida TaxID=1094350 RepID=A0A9P5D4C5_9HYPO|nr:to cystathionine beta-synthase beta-thionase [Geosmithia morbida]KAF4121354.1 to cystathionine beta-synthase beta-thionase [Geosmithia morbida]
MAPDGQKTPPVSEWSSRYRGATVEDLDPPPALSLNPTDAISVALMSAFERDYTHLTVVDGETRSLLGYISIPRLQSLLDAGTVQPSDPLSSAMMRFQRRGRKYQIITTATTLEDLEAFFRGDGGESKPDPDAAAPWSQDFAVVTDENRRFVLGVATVSDLEEFVKRRPA